MIWEEVVVPCFKVL